MMRREALYGLSPKQANKDSAILQENGFGCDISKNNEGEWESVLRACLRCLLLPMMTH